MARLRPSLREPVGRDAFRRFHVRWALFASVLAAILVAVMAVGAVG